MLYYHLLPLGVQILIAAGDIDISNYHERIREYSRISADLPSSAYILEAHFHRDTYQIIEISYLDLPKMPIALGICEDLFGCICDGRVVFGLGAYYTKDVFELTRGNRWKMLPNRKFLIYFSASCYMKNYLFVTGGSKFVEIPNTPPLGCVGECEMEPSEGFDTIEMLEISAHHTGSSWKICSSKLPFRVDGHNVVAFNNQLLLIGGKHWPAPSMDRVVDGRNNPFEFEDSYENSNEVWVGNFEDESNDCEIQNESRIVWSKLNSMNYPRSCHFSFVIDGKVYVVGGQIDDMLHTEPYADDSGRCVVEIFDGENWEIGPEFPCKIDSLYFFAGLDDQKRIFVFSKKVDFFDHDIGIIVYNTQTGVMSVTGKLKMKDDRGSFASFFL